MTVLELKRQARAKPPVYKLTVDDWQRRIAADIVNETDCLELSDGAWRSTAPTTPADSDRTVRLTELLIRRTAGRALVSVQNPLPLPPHAEPAPDLMLLCPRADDDEAAHPPVADRLRVIAVAVSSLTVDRGIVDLGIKVPLYARHGVPEVWLLDLMARRMEVYRDPSPEGSARIRYPRPDEELAPALLPELVIRGRDLW